MTGMWALLLAAVFLIGDSGFQVVEVSRPRLPRLRSALLRREKEDQAARNAWVRQMQASGGKVGPSPEMKRMERVDAANRNWLKRVIARYGWPGRSLAGKDGAHAAWLLVQHADADRPFQKRCLILLERAVKRGEARGDDLAYLTDRVLVGEGKPQRYGTQTKIIDGEVKPDPMEDEAHVDQRRAALRMMPMAKYLVLVRKMYLGDKQ